MILPVCNWSVEILAPCFRDKNPRKGNVSGLAVRCVGLCQPPASTCLFTQLHSLFRLQFFWIIKLILDLWSANISCGPWSSSVSFPLKKEDFFFFKCNCKYSYMPIMTSKPITSSTHTLKVLMLLISKMPQLAHSKVWNSNVKIGSKNK